MSATSEQAEVSIPGAKNEFVSDDGYIVFSKNIDKHAAYITLNRPDMLNAARSADYITIKGLLHDAEMDDDVKTIVFRGEGTSFCAGHDVDEIGRYYGIGDTSDDRRASQRQRVLPDHHWIYGQDGIYQAIMRCNKVTITEAKGYCYGSGCLIALNTDIVIASEDAKFIHPAFRYIGPSIDAQIALWMLTIGLRRTKEAMLLGQPIEAQEALELGLVNRVVPRDELESTVDQWVTTLDNLPKDGVVMGKIAFEIAMDQLGGLAEGANTGALIHAWSTNIRFEEGEWNLLRTRRNKGKKGAIQERDARYPKL